MAKHQRFNIQDIEPKRPKIHTRLIFVAGKTRCNQTQHSKQ